MAAQLGNGFPDLLVGVPRGEGLAIGLVEVKDGRLPPSHRQLTDKEQAFHRKWHGAPLFIVENDADALKVLDMLRGIA